MTDSRKKKIPCLGQRGQKPYPVQARWEREGELATTSLEFKVHLQFSCGSPSTELSDFGQSA